MTKSVMTATVEREQEGDHRQMADALREALAASPRAIPPLFFYDALGSALFDAICELPWYPVTRAETALLRAHAVDIGHITTPARLVELGPGNGRKAALLARGLRRPSLDVHLVDISAAALSEAHATVGGVEGVRVTTHATTYEAGLAAVRPPADGDGATLVAFLGSNIGNFDPRGACAFLGALRGEMREGDFLLVGADLVKPERELLLAYDDPLGVTAAFNKNVLARINREFDADFDLDLFAHEARWQPRESRVEMHLVSRQDQVVTIEQVDLAFQLRAGETIWTESSYKYEPDSIVGLVRGAGFAERAQWIDPIRRFALTLFSADSRR
ncbi:MAG: L-histidine N(alpha)-methyltransferase [Bacteroidales bacterium]